MGKLTLSLRGLGREEADPAELRQNRTGVTNDTRSAGRSYARDTDVLFMIGDPMGLPPPLAMRSKVNVLRGSESKQVRY